MKQPTQIKKISALLEELERCFQRKAKIEQLAAGALEDDFDIDIEMNIRNKEQDNPAYKIKPVMFIDFGNGSDHAADAYAYHLHHLTNKIKNQESEIENLQSQLTYHEVLPDTTALQVLGILIHGIDAQINQLTAQLESYGVNIKMK